MAKAKKDTPADEGPDYDPFTARSAGGDNVVPLKNDKPAQDAIIATQLGKMQRAKAEYETANGNYRNTLKHVESKGVHLAAAKRALAIKKSSKVEETLAELQALFEYLTILGAPIQKSQLDLFRVEAPRTPGVEKAKATGRYTGLMGGGTGENPYALDSEQGQAWMAGFHDGTTERGLVMAMEPDGDELISGDDPDDDDDLVDDEDAED